MATLVSCQVIRTDYVKLKVDIKQAFRELQVSSQDNTQN